MKAILIDLSSKENNFQQYNQFSGLSTAVVNKPLLVHQIEKLKKAGIENITVLSSNNISKELTDGKRWNVELDFIETLSVDHLVNQTDDTDVLIMPANILLDLDITLFIKDYKDSISAFSSAKSSTADYPAFPDYFHPMLIQTLKLKEILGAQQENPPLVFAGNLYTALSQAGTFECAFDIHFLDTHQNYWLLHKKILKSNPDTIDYPGFPLADNLWVDVDVRIHPQAEIDGIVIIGRHSKILKGAKFKGFVVIGDNVVIDSRAEIENSIIMDNTYIGSDIHIKNSIANKNFLFQADKSIGLVVEDNFILSETGWGKRFFARLGKWRHGK